MQCRKKLKLFKEFTFLLTKTYSNIKLQGNLTAFLSLAIARNRQNYYTQLKDMTIFGKNNRKALPPFINSISTQNVLLIVYFLYFFKSFKSLHLI